MELNGAKILYTIHTDIPLLGDLKITQTLVTTWIVMALLSGLAIWLGSNLKLENVSKRQAAAEFIVERLDQFVHDNMGYHFDKYIPLIGSIFALSIGCNLISVIGLWSPTADLNTEAAWAIVVFVLIMYYKIKTNGIFSYLKGLLDPIFIMAPINVLSEISTPVSMAFRHFGNIAGGNVLTSLVYSALATASAALLGLVGKSIAVGILILLGGVALLVLGVRKKKLAYKIFGAVFAATGILSLLGLAGVPYLEVGIPGIMSLYFDVFSGGVQALVFSLLTMVYVSNACPPPEEG